MNLNFNSINCLTLSQIGEGGQTIPAIWRTPPTLAIVIFVMQNPNDIFFDNFKDRYIYIFIHNSQFFYFILDRVQMQIMSIGILQELRLVNYLYLSKNTPPHPSWTLLKEYQPNIILRRRDDIKGDWFHCFGILLLYRFTDTRIYF